MNNNDDTKAFLKYSIARNWAVTGRADKAIRNYHELYRFGFSHERQAEVRYHLINCSFALRQQALYGSSEVSTELRLSGPGQGKELTARIDLEFDALKEITSFCKDFDIDPQKFDRKSVHDLVRRGNGPAGIKIVYFYHLEKMLRGGSDHHDLTSRYNIIERLLRILSETRRSDDSGTCFTTDAWYPLIFLYSVCVKFGHFELANHIDMTINSFDGWANADALNSSVALHKDQGSFLTSVHKLNVSCSEKKRHPRTSISSSINRLGKDFETIKLFPAISRLVNYSQRNAGKAVDPFREISSYGVQAVSHWNYIVDEGKLID